jgi:hypothetical protein
VPWLLIIAIVALCMWQGDGNPLDGAVTLLNEITRGKRLTHASYGDDGVVPADPNDLAAQAGLSLDAYALARMISSEEGQSSNRVKAAVAHAAITHAAKGGKTISQVLLHAVDPNHSGYFGTFKNIDEDSPNYTTDSKGNPNAADRYASTALDPYDGDGQIAVGCIDGSIPDETGGADQFDRPSGERDPDAVAAKRVKAGKTLVMLDGVDDIRFWRG